MRWKDEIVGRLTGGVAALLKKNGVRVVKGWARIVDGKTVEVSANDGSQRIGCEHLLLAAGSQEVELPGLPFGGSVVSSTEALSPTSLPRRLPSCSLLSPSLLPFSSVSRRGRMPR